MNTSYNANAGPVEHKFYSNCKAVANGLQQFGKGTFFVGGAAVVIGGVMAGASPIVGPLGVAGLAVFFAGLGTAVAGGLIYGLGYVFDQVVECCRPENRT